MGNGSINLPVTADGIGITQLTGAITTPASSSGSTVATLGANISNPTFVLTGALSTFITSDVGMKIRANTAAGAVGRCILMNVAASGLKNWCIGGILSSGNDNLNIMASSSPDGATFSTPVATFASNGTVTIPTLTGTTFTSGAFASSTANPATAGVLRLASTNSVAWRNNANSGNLTLASDASDIIQSSTSMQIASGFFIGNLKASSGTVATAGAVRLSAGDSLGWRNNANSGNIFVGIDASDNFTVSGTTTSGTATAGGVGTLPVTVGGYLVINLGSGVTAKIPLYAP